MFRLRPWLLAILSVVSMPVLAVPGDLAAFQEQVAETLESRRVPGAGIALISEGEIIWAGGVGYADLSRGLPVMPDTRFRIGSITKMFTSLAILRLIDEGRLSLDDAVHDLAPEVPIDNAWRDVAPVRIAHLLEHTAGFDDMHFRNMTTAAPLPDSLRDTVMALEHELRVRWQPGVKHAYSNPGYAVAAYLVEKISGEPFHRYLREQLLAPLELEGVTWGVPADEAYALGHAKGSRRIIPPLAIRLYPAGELSASPADLARLVMFFLDRGRVDGEPFLSEALLNRMETPRTTRAARAGLENGYGLGNYTSFRARFRLQGHNGGLDGFLAELAYSPEHRFGYVVLLNQVNNEILGRLSHQAATFLAARQDINAPEPGALDAADAIAPRELSGCYRMTNPRNELLHGLEWLLQVTCISVEDRQVRVQHPVIPQAEFFTAVKTPLLREIDSAWATAVYLAGDGMPDAFQWSGIYFERSNRIAVTLPLAVAVATLLLMFSAVAFFPVWAFRGLRGRLRSAPHVSVRVWPLLASLMFAFTLLWSTRLELTLLDSVNAVTLGIFLGGVAFALTSFYAVFAVIRTWNAGIHPGVRWHSLLVALACCALVLYLMYWRLLPLRLWAW